MGIKIKPIDMTMKLHNLITDINTNIFCIKGYHEYANETFFMQISSAITTKLNFINISTNINCIQIIIVSLPRFSWARNILRPFSDRSHVAKMDLWDYNSQKVAKICLKFSPKDKIAYY